MSCSKSLYSKEIVPELFFLLFKETTSPVFSSRVFCKSRMLESFFETNLNFFSLNCLVRVSDCLTDSFFYIIFFAISSELLSPIKDLACPADKLPSWTNKRTSSGRDNNLKEFAM